MTWRPGMGGQHQIASRTLEQVQVGGLAAAGGAAPGGGLPRPAARAVDGFAVCLEPVADFKEALFLAFIERAVPMRAPGGQQIAVAAGGADEQVQEMIEGVGRLAGVTPGIGERDAGFPRPPVLKAPRMPSGVSKSPGSEARLLMTMPGCNFRIMRVMFSESHISLVNMPSQDTASHHQMSILPYLVQSSRTTFFWYSRYRAWRGPSGLVSPGFKVQWMPFS